MRIKLEGYGRSVTVEGSSTRDVRSAFERALEASNTIAADSESKVEHTERRDKKVAAMQTHIDTLQKQVDAVSQAFEAGRIVVKKNG